MAQPRDAAGRQPPRRPTGAGPAADGQKPAAGTREKSRLRQTIAPALLILLALVAYLPALSAGFIWDDDAHITRAGLRSLDGLVKIWSQLGATQQYYPGLHSFFWLQHLVFGDAPAGYHAVNIALHIANALLLVAILRFLDIRGAWLVGAVFAVHPVMVESVAWITEQKNTLSTFFYFCAALGYLRFDASRSRRWYAVAALGFLAALSCKSVTATLPAALLVVFWWKRGSLTVRRDVLPLVPFFVVGVASGVFTAWVEWHLIGARGAEFSLSTVERLLLAGRIPAFYLGKLLWPGGLMFTYPRWTIDARSLLQYAFPAGVLLVLLALWQARRWSRAPLAAALFFVGTLFPVLGFFNVYPFRFSFVADHFQYLASVGVFVLLGAGLAQIGDSLVARGTPRWAIVAAAGAFLLVLAGLSWRQSRLYEDEETLFRATLAQNPDAWMAHLNLGMRLAQTGRGDEAMEHYREAVRLYPWDATVHYNLGLGFVRLGQRPEAIASFREAIRLKPNYAHAHNNLGSALASGGDVLEALGHFEAAVRFDPNLIDARRNYGLALVHADRRVEALEQLRTALRQQPGDVRTRRMVETLERELGLPQRPESAR
jgi:protein O-mannosyl-transferase